GAPVVRESEGNTKILRCQYHSWAYDLAGNLIKVPDLRDFKDFDPSCKKLKKVHCDTWGGWVYISLSEDNPGSLIDFLNPVAHELECFKSSELITVYKKSVTVKANWKTCLDAFMEVYHAPTIHKDTVNILLDGSAMAAGLLKNGHSRISCSLVIHLSFYFINFFNIHDFPHHYQNIILLFKICQSFVCIVNLWKFVF
ncbi:Rieske 2Fe-2S domain-containing protein, partial [Hyphomicrobiales bacterium]|nr:Rieske 2Fe-2S domain-containing protein [Hyphomicrobiales bacterium]